MPPFSSTATGQPPRLFCGKPDANAYNGSATLSCRSPTGFSPKRRGGWPVAVEEKGGMTPYQEISFT